MSTSNFYAEIPILDISQPLQPSSLSSLSKASKDWGFFNIINHGISKDLCIQLHSISKPLFSLPSDTKLKLGPISSAKSYTPHFIASPFFESLKVIFMLLLRVHQKSSLINRIPNSGKT